MKTTLAILLLSGQLVYGASPFTEWFCVKAESGGTNVNAGSTTNTPVFNQTGGNFTNTTGGFAKAGANFSGVTVGMWASVYVDGSIVTPFVGRVVLVDDVNDFMLITNIAGFGTKPTDGTGNRSCRVGGPWYGPYGTATYTDGFPLDAIENRATNFPSLPPRVNMKDDHDYIITSNVVRNIRGYVRFEAFHDIPGDAGDVYPWRMANIYADTNTAVMFYQPFVNSGNFNEYRYLNISGGGTNSNGAIHTNMVSSTGSGSVWYRCRFHRSWEGGLVIGGASGIGNQLIVECESDRNNINGANATGGFMASQDSTWVRCWSHDSNWRGDTDADGWYVDASAEIVTFRDCISSGNAGRGWQFTGSTIFLDMTGCAAVSNGNFGMSWTASSFSITNGSTVNLEGCIYVGNTWGLVGPTQTNSPFAVRALDCAFFGNGGTFSNFNSQVFVNNITLTSQPFIDPINGNFGLNDTAGGGAALRYKPKFFTQGTNWTHYTTNYLDVGPAQATNSASSGGGITTIILGR